MKLWDYGVILCVLFAHFSCLKDVFFFILFTYILHIIDKKIDKTLQEKQQSQDLHLFDLICRQVWLWYLHKKG